MRLSTSVTFWLVATVFASNCLSVLPTWATFEPRRVICASMASRALLPAKESEISILVAESGQDFRFRYGTVRPG